MPDDQKPMFEADKESRSVNQTADAAKPDAGGSEDRQHENPCPELAQPCGHPASAVASSDEGTAYCAMCEAEQPTCGIAGCVGKHHPQDHNATVDARACAACNEPAKGDATIDGERYCHEGESPTCYEKASWLGDDQSRSLFHSLQDAIRERNALRAELEHVRRERNTIHDWYVDAKTENVRLRAEVERMRPVVEAAIAVVETDKRLYHGAAEHAEAEAEAAFTMLDEAVDAYRKDTNDE